MALLKFGPATGGDIELYGGDSAKVYVKIERNGVEENLSQSTYFMEIRNGQAVVHSLNSDLGITIETEGGGIMILDFPSEVMVTMPFGSYVYDMKQVYPDGKVKTRFRGAFVHTQDVTKIVV